MSINPVALPAQSFSVISFIGYIFECCFAVWMFYSHMGEADVLCHKWEEQEIPFNGSYKACILF